MKTQNQIYNLSKGVDLLSKEEHGRFFDTVQQLGLSNEVKQAAVALYLDFKSRPIGEYNADHKNLDIFLIASVSLAAKVMGDFRTDQEFESKIFVAKERLADAEERILRSFGVRNNVIPYSEIVLQLSKRQIETMADIFSERGLIDSTEKQRLVQLSFENLDAALENGLSPKMSYRGRAAGVVLKSVRDLGLQVSEAEIARAAGFDKKTMTINANIMAELLDYSKRSDRKGTEFG